MNQGSGDFGAQSAKIHPFTTSMVRDAGWVGAFPTSTLASQTKATFYFQMQMHMQAMTGALKVIILSLIDIGISLKDPKLVCSWSFEMELATNL